MALGDFVRAKDAQHDPSQQNDDHINALSSRQRAAELARVDVPRTKLDGFNRGATANTRQGHRQQPAPWLQSPRAAAPTHGQNVPEGFRDVFDTDVEGIDDSTTVTSLSFNKGEDAPVSEENIPPREEAVRPQGRVNQRLVPANYQPREPVAAPKTVAERMRELDSDPDDAGGADMGVQQTRYSSGVTDQYEMGNEINYGNAHMFNWNSIYAADSGPLSWQRIEEVLHENRHNHRGKTAAPAPDPSYQDQEQWGGKAPAFSSEDTGRHHSRSQTPPSAQNTPVKGRISVRSRFTAPNFPNERNSGHFRVARKKSQSYIPVPSSMPANSSSAKPARPKSATKPTTAAEEAGSPISRRGEETNDGQYSQGGMFDNTDMSALDSPGATEEENDNQNQARASASPHLSTVSPRSPSASSAGKRPLSPDEPASAAPSFTPTRFISDYAPNILETKTFADLASESFDYNPAPPQPIFPPQEPALSLNERLMRLRTLTDDQRRALFSSLTLAEWEESGDWLIEQFGEILEKTKDARRERREVAGVFEAEIKRRFESTEAEGRDVQQRLDEMRSGGMGVLKKQNSSSSKG